MLRTRITLVVVAAVVFAIALGAFLSFRTVSGVVGEELERGLRARADAVAALVDAGGTPPVRPGTAEQLLRPDGSVVPGARLPLPVPERARDVARTGRGSHVEDRVVAGTEYGIITVALPRGGAVMVAQSYAGALRTEEAFLWRTSLSTAAATGITALLSWLVLGRVLGPVRRLDRAARRITGTQDLSVPLPPAGRDEIGRLTRSFGVMLEALRRSRAQQQQLVQDAGHELRTPLTSVRGSAELLQRARGRLSPADEEQILGTLVSETVALDELVRELVELATDRYTGEEPEDVDLVAAAEESTARCRQRTGRTVTVAAPSDPADREGPGVTVRARPRAVQRCVDNLLSNAVKFSPAGTPVEVRVAGGGALGELVVADRGPGIPPGEEAAVFGRFHRGPGTQGTPGSGLGLAIVDDLVGADGGTVFARNGADGGAEVGFRLPAAVTERRARGGWGPATSATSGGSGRPSRGLRRERQVP
ncbi:HAMP domain-containing sensor histidine kinase [Streptomyces sp. NPDC097619]|uniref:HAMP domain-containing sensor histidine kinase n=1 Tax=Streptomyces sp. NPDC097619 TaxID=3157228 RepID=UPI003326C69B